MLATRQFKVFVNAIKADNPIWNWNWNWNWLEQSFHFYPQTPRGKNTVLCSDSSHLLRKFISYIRPFENRLNWIGAFLSVIYSGLNSWKNCFRFFVCFFFLRKVWFTWHMKQFFDLITKWYCAGIRKFSGIYEAGQDNRILKFLMTLTQVILNATIQVENDKDVSTEANTCIMKTKTWDFF